MCLHWVLPFSFFNPRIKNSEKECKISKSSMTQHRSQILNVRILKMKILHCFVAYFQFLNKFEILENEISEFCLENVCGRVCVSSRIGE